MVAMFGNPNLIPFSLLPNLILNRIPTKVPGSVRKEGCLSLFTGTFSTNNLYLFKEIGETSSLLYLLVFKLMERTYNFIRQNYQGTKL